MTDVRYRLSAEGVADVVAAFRTVAAESRKSGAASSGAFTSLGASLGNLRAMIGGVVAALGVMRLASIVKEASDAAEKIDLLSATFSESVENISALDVALRRMGTSLGEQGRAFSAFLQKTGEASKGIGTAADDFRALGLSTKEIRNFAEQDLAARFETVSRAFAQMPVGVKRSEAAIRALGVRFAQLIPLMEDVGRRGMGGLRSDADKLGALLSGDVVRAAASAGDAFDDLNIQSRALAVQFTAGLAPSFGGALRGMTAELADTGSGFRAFGNLVGMVLGAVTIAIVGGIDIALTRIANLLKWAGSGAKAIAHLVFGEFEKADLEISRVRLRATSDSEALERRMKMLRESAFGGEVSDRRQLGPTFEEFEGLRAAEQQALRDRIALSNAQTAATLSITKARIKLIDEQEQRHYERGLSSLEQHYENRRAIVNRSYDAELAALVRNRADAVGEDNEGKRLAAVERIDGEIKKLAIERAGALAGIKAKESDAAEALAREQLELDAKVAGARGDQHQQRLLEIGLEAEAVRRSMVDAGAGAEEAERRAASYRSVLEQQEALSQKTTEAETALSELSREREAVQREIDAGLVSEVTGNERILQLNKERLGLLRLISADLSRTADETGSEADRQRAVDFSDQVDAVSKAVDASQGSFEQFKARGIDATRDALEDFFATGISSATTFEGVMRSMAQAVVSSLQRLAAQLLATRIAVSIFGGIAGAAASGGGAAAGGAGVQATDLYVGAAGGLVTGPGTATSDSIPARLSTGEYVVRAAAVSQPGAREFLEALNATLAFHPVQDMGIRRFSEGGFAAPQISVPAQAARMEGTVTVGLEDGLVARGIDSSEGERAVLRILTKHRRSIGRILG